MKRHRCLMAIMVATSVAGLVACSGKPASSPSPPIDSSGGSASSLPQPVVPSSAAPASATEVRLGCGEYCQNAGGYGGAVPMGRTPVDAMQVVEGAVSVDADGYVPVTLTCLVPATCQGAVLLHIDGHSSSEYCGGGKYIHDGCSELFVDANSTRTIWVPFAPESLAYARTHSPVTVEVEAEANQPGCVDLPQLGGCDKIAVRTPAVGQLQVSLP